MRHYIAKSGRRYPMRYFSGLTRRNQLIREKELVHRRSRTQYTDTKAKTRKSKWTALFHRTFPNQKFNKAQMAKRFKIPYSTLNTVYKRGERAWQTSGSRPGANPYQWAIPRVYKFILIEIGKVKPTKKIDPDMNLHTGRAKTTRAAVG
jgi:hypothetical protein